MLFLLPWPNMKGHLPVLTELVVKEVYITAASATATPVMVFDTNMAGATTFAIGTESSGVTTSVWGRAHYPVVSTALLPHNANYVACVPLAVQAANTFCDVLVLGRCTLTKVGTADNAAGQGYLMSMATLGAIAPTAARGTTLNTAAENRKVVHICDTAASSSPTTVTGYFNGFGWGVAFTNVAYGADPA